MAISCALEDVVWYISLDAFSLAASSQAWQHKNSESGQGMQAPQIARCSANHFSALFMEPGIRRHVRMQPCFSDLDEATGFQHTYVFCQARQSHVEWLSEFAHGSLALREPRNDCAPRWIGERAEHVCRDEENG